MCPWRIENFGKPPEQVEIGSWVGYYTAITRERMWTKWGPDGEGLSDGIRMFCHKTGEMDDDSRACPVKPGGKVHACTGGDALQQRAALRAWRGGGLGPLRSWDAVREIVGDMLGGELSGMRSATLAIKPERGQWTRKGAPITFEQLLAAAHPAVFDPAIASEQVPPPTPEELADWGRQLAGDSAAA